MMNKESADRAMFCAILSGDIYAFRSSLEAGADINAIDDETGLTAIGLAVASGRELLKIVLDSGANPNQQTAEEMPPLLQATMARQFALVEMLVSRGASVDFESCENSSSLHYAADFGEKEILAGLLKSMRNKSIDCFDSVGKTPFMCAVEREHFDVADFLLDEGANIDACDRNALGYTALHNAVLIMKEPQVKYLCDRGADTLIRDIFGKSAYAVAHEHQHEGCTRICEIVNKASEKQD